MSSTADPSLPDSLLTLAASIVSAHVANNAVNHIDIPRMIRDVYETLREVDQSNPHPAPTTARSSGKATPDVLVCLECGMRMKMLKRHLLTVHQLTPEAYRAKHRLPADSPMVTSNYAALRSQLAKASGLGKRPAKGGGKRR